jgi:hypothetical protein
MNPGDRSSTQDQLAGWSRPDHMLRVVSLTLVILAAGVSSAAADP